MSRLSPLASFASLVLLAGCPLSGKETVERGGLGACIDGARAPAEGEVVSLTGSVTAITPDDPDCGTLITVDDGAGTAHTVGLLVRDADGVADAPVVALEVGAPVSLLYRYAMVWGDVTGFVLTDDTGVILAAEEGGWGGALQEGDVAGLTVTRGDEVVATEATDCMPIEGFSLTFSGDTSVELVPVSEGEVTVGGQPLTARAVAAWDYGQGTNCEMSDVSGYSSWVVYRGGS